MRNWGQGLFSSNHSPHRAQRQEGESGKGGLCGGEVVGTQIKDEAGKVGFGQVTKGLDSHAGSQGPHLQCPGQA